MTARGRQPTRRPRFMANQERLDRIESAYKFNLPAPRFLADELRPLADIPSRWRLCSASSPALAVPSTRRRTIGDRAFPVAAARAWNGLPTEVTTAPEAILSHSTSFNGTPPSLIVHLL